MDLTGNEIFAHPAAILSGDRAVLDQATLLQIARGIMPDPSVLSESEPFFWTAEVSNDRLDSYFTRMSESTLRNYEEDANTGVSFQNSHRTDELGLGRSLQARFYGPQGNGVSRLEVTFYTLRGLRLTNLSTDDFIRGVRSGIVRDVSVGFYGGRYVCSICGRDMLKDWDCTHVPGMKYDMVDPATGRRQSDQLSFAWVDDARLAEVSAVYEGSTPGAAILKATREAEAGRLTPIARTVIEQRYRVALPGKRVVSGGIDLPSGVLLDPAATQPEPAAIQGETMTAPEAEQVVSGERGGGPAAGAVEREDAAVVGGETESVGVPPEDDRATEIKTQVDGDAPETGVAPDAVDTADPGERAPGQPSDQPTGSAPADQGLLDQEEQAMNEEQTRDLSELATVRQLLGVSGAADGVRGLQERLAELQERVTELTATQARVRQLEQDNERLTGLADLGVQYRASLVDEAVAEGIRAEGNGFPAETYKALLENASIDHIKTVRDSFRSRADTVLAGGRKTQDVVTAPEAAPEAPAAENKRKPLPAEAYRVG